MEALTRNKHRKQVNYGVSLICHRYNYSPCFYNSLELVQKMMDCANAEELEIGWRIKELEEESAEVFTELIIQLRNIVMRKETGRAEVVALEREFEEIMDKRSRLDKIHVFALEPFLQAALIKYANVFADFEIEITKKVCLGDSVLIQ